MWMKFQTQAVSNSSNLASQVIHEYNVYHPLSQYESHPDSFNTGINMWMKI